MPIERFTFRAWEAMTWAPESEAPFRASAHYRTDAAYGDLASMANLPDERRYHAETFTTDAFGFRNDRPPGNPEMLLLGDSFGAGCAADDDQTLSTRLESLTGRAVYNAAGIDPKFDWLERLLQRLHMTRGTVVLQSLERGAVPTRFWTRGLGDRWPFSLLRSPFSASPLKIVLQKAYRAILDDRILPNTAASAVLVRTLPDGTTMLFIDSDATEVHTSADAERAVARFRAMAEWLAHRGLRLAVVLVPNKFTVYGPLTSQGADVAANRAYLRRMAEGLRVRGIASIDLTPAFEEEARRTLLAKQYLYRLDDTHWSPEGIAFAAQQVAGMLHAFGPP